MTKKRGNIEADEKFLRSIPLPEATDTYTVIAHGTIIDKVRNELSKNGFTIDTEVYLTSVDGQIALCKVYLQCDKDPDMGMIFTWWNSYNKRVKFGCAVGSFIYDNRASLIGSEGMSWIRKHTGTADQEADSILEQLIAAANDYFDKIIAEKNKMKSLPLSVEDYGCIMGALYFEHELITPTQASAVIQERKKPTNNYSDRDTLWGLYKILMFGIEGMDITKWVKSQQKLHHMIMTEYAIVQEDYLSVPITAQKENQAAEEKVLIDNTVEIEADEEFPSKEEAAANARENTRNFFVNQKKYDAALVDFWMENHYKDEMTFQECEEAFYKYTAIPAKQLSEEQIELVKEEHGKEDETIIFEQPESSDEELDLLLSVNDDTSDVLNNLDEPVEIIEPKDDFVFPTDLDNPDKLAEGLEVPDEVVEQAKEIEARMKTLYGSVRPYHVEDNLVIIDETLECFSI